METLEAKDSALGRGLRGMEPWTPSVTKLTQGGY